MRKKIPEKNAENFFKRLKNGFLFMNLGMLCMLVFNTHEIQAQQQQKEVSGTVTNAESGDPLPGVTIVVLGTNLGTSTNVDGEYSIEVSPDDKLVFSYVGMEEQEVSVGEKETIDVEMEPRAEELGEVTVVAFGEQETESVVSSIGTIRPGKLQIPSTNLTEGLAGRMGGLISYQRSGAPGQDNVEFFIRGITTFGYKQDPLILIDGVEVTSRQLSRMEPDNIESFSILKDATATALYGSRGANGVIIVKTKEGKEQEAQVEARYETSLSGPTNTVDVASPITYMQLHNEAVKTRDPLGVAPYGRNKIENTKDPDRNKFVYPANNWQEILFKDYAVNKRFNFNVNGGGKVAQYYLAGSVHNENGLLKNVEKNDFDNNIDFSRYMLRSNVTIGITETTEAVVRLRGAFDDYSGPVQGADATYRDAMNTNPVLFPPYYEPDSAHQHVRHIMYGNYEENAQYNNPYADITKGFRDYSISRMSIQFELDQQLDFITEGLSVDAMFNLNRFSRFDVFRQYNPFYYQVSTYNKEEDEYRLQGLNTADGTEYLEYEEGEKQVHSVNYFETTLNWNRTYSEIHDLSGLLVYSMRERLVANAGSLIQSLPRRNLNVAGRFTYSYDDRYLTELNFGYNGSERFSKNERFGLFPSIGVGWRISNESFWTGRLKNTFSNLKVRLTYGFVGNSEIGSAQDRFFYLSNVNMNDPAHGASFGRYGDSYSQPGISISRYPNRNITWETAEKLNLALDMDLWEDLTINADFYKNKRTNILMDRASIPTTMGLQSTVRANVGAASSKGMDLNIKYNHFVNQDFWISGMANFTYATSEFEVYEEPDYSKADAPWRSRKGQSLTQNWGYVAERLFVDKREVDNSPSQFGDYQAGDIKYKDIKRDGRITGLDQVPIGYPTSPEISFGFGPSIGYQAFDFSIFFQGLARQSFWISPSQTAPFIGGQRALLQAYADDHWSEEERNINALWPRLSNSQIENNNQTSTWFMRDGSFVRLKSLEVGYTLPKEITSRVEISKFRIYFSGRNLATFSKFDLWDPEMGGNGLGYPLQRVYNLGVNLNF